MDYINSTCILLVRLMGGLQNRYYGEAVASTLFAVVRVLTHHNYRSVVMMVRVNMRRGEEDSFCLIFQ